jgi:rRNA pseudouridine-1189 N-methylase Emg1 (Nep1/Mra1 family)
MVEKIKGKRVPWSQLEEYLAIHKNTITTFIDLQKSEVMEIPDIEARLPNSFTQLHKVVSKILKDNNILPNEEEAKVDQL